MTSVGSGVFFGMTLAMLFPLSARRIVGTDLFHGMLVTLAAGAGHHPLGRSRTTGTSAGSWSARSRAS